MAQLSFYYPLHKFTREQIPVIIREFLDNGVERFVFSDGLIAQCLQDQTLIDFLRKLCQDMHICLVSMHGLFGKDRDLNVMEADLRPKLIEEHIRAMEIARDFGSLTYTVHIGAYYYTILHHTVQELRKYAIDSLEQLVPAAERIGITLAVENSFEKTNSAREVEYYMKQFEGSSAIGVCYDTGHANCMASAAWKRWENYPDYQRQGWWEGFETEDGALERLKNHIVTCHIHDNDGYRDLHSMPHDGVIDWAKLIPALKSCPNMLEYQTEVTMDWGDNWAGHLPAPIGGYSIRRLVDTFRKFNF